MKCLVVAGPTASGKSTLAIALAKKFSLPVLSADARQVYAEMHIGTARPLPEEWEGVPHYLLGHVSIHAPYDAHQYCIDAEAVLDALKLQRYPAFVLVGGSGLYIHSLLYGIDTMPPIPAAIRAQIREELRQGAMAPLAEEVRIADPVFASSADLQNPRRIQRALEVIRTTGRPYSAYRTSTTKEKYQSLWLVPEWQRDALYARIHQRTEAMVAQGFEAEARALWSYKHLQALQTVGYREWFAYFDGQSTREAAIEQIKMQTRRYAKRQITWFRNQAPTFFPLKNASISEALTLAEAFLK